MLSSCPLINLYGCTKGAGDVTYYELYSPTADDTAAKVNHRGLSGVTELSEKYKDCVPIGYAIDNNYLFVVHKRCV